MSMFRLPAARLALVADVTAAGLWLALLVLLAAAGGDDPTYTRHALGLLLGAGLTYAAGRLGGRRHAAPLLLAVAGAAVVVVLSDPDIASGGAAAGPLDYGNANGAFLAVGVAAGVAAAVRGQAAVRWAGLALAGVLLLVLPTTRSAAATLLAVAVGAAALVALWGRGRLVALLAGALLVAVAAVTVTLGAGYAGPGSGAAARALSQRRVDLWSDAVDLAGDHPWDGVGLGAFPRESPTAREDRDTRFAHSLPLELAAEAGVAAGGVAVLLGLALVVTAASGERAHAATAAWAVAVFAAQASLDYTYRFPAVVLPAALVAGLAAARSEQTSRVLGTPARHP